MAMLDEGTDTLDSVAIAKQQQRLGAEISTSSTLDSSTVYLNALKEQLEPSLHLFARIVRQPAFRKVDIERIRGKWLATIAQEKTEPVGLALRTLPPLLYGEGHAYAIPFTGSGTETSIASLTADDMRAFMRDYIRPENATILVAGDTTFDAIILKLNAATLWAHCRSRLRRRPIALEPVGAALNIAEIFWWNRRVGSPS